MYAGLALLLLATLALASGEGREAGLKGEGDGGRTGEAELDWKKN